MTSDSAPEGQDGKPIHKFGFVKTLSSLMFDDGKSRRGRVVGIKPNKNDKGNPDIVVSFDIGGEDVVKTVKAEDLRAAGSPKAWLGKPLKPEGSIGELVSWKERDGIHVGAVGGGRPSRSRINLIDLDTGKVRNGFKTDKGQHIDEGDLTPEQLDIYERTGLRGRDSEGNWKDAQALTKTAQQIRADLKPRIDEQRRLDKEANREERAERRDSKELARAERIADLDTGKTKKGLRDGQHIENVKPHSRTTHSIR